MTGLLTALEDLSVNVDISVTLQPQVDALGNVSGAVNVLAEGPSALADIELAADALPAAPALEGLGNLLPALDGVISLTQGDFEAAFDGLTAPLIDLIASLDVSPAGKLACFAEIVREALKIVTGRAFGGALGMPDGGLQLPELLDLAEIEANLAQADQLLDDFGPTLDASRLLQVIQEVAPGFSELSVRMPPIPVIRELFDALATAARWQALDGPSLTAEMSASLHQATRVIDMPYDRVVAPVAAAGAIAVEAPDRLATAAAQITRIVAALRPGIIAGSVNPGKIEIDALDSATQSVEEIAATLDPQNPVWADCDGVICDLVETRLAALAALSPNCSGVSFVAEIQAWIDTLPEADPTMFDGLVSSIEDIDLAALTDPLAAIQQAVEDAVATVNDARNAVRDQITTLVAPVADSLDSAIGAAQLAEIQAALDALPAQIQQFVDDEIVANLGGVRDGISDAIDQISDLADDFDPEVLTAPIRDSIQQVGSLVNNPEVEGAFADVESALDEAIRAIGEFDLAPAADESINLIGEIDATLAEINPDDIPDAAKPLIAQGVEVVANINFTVEISTPLNEAVTAAVEAGPDVVLRAIEEAMTEARISIEAFRPSAVIADTLDAPFSEALALLEDVSPAVLFGRIETALEDVQDRVQVLDVGAVVDPLEDVHARVVVEVEKLRPSVLMAPVEAALEGAIAKVLELSGFDSALEGISEVIAEINRWVGVIGSMRDILARLALMLDTPGDAAAEVDALIESTVDRLDLADLGGLSAGFAATGAAVTRNGRDAIAGALATAYLSAGSTGPGIASDTSVANLAEITAAFPLASARALPASQERDRLIAVIDRLTQAVAAIQASATPWGTLGPKLNSKALSLQEDLTDYHLAEFVDDVSVLASFASPPGDMDAVKAEVRQALEASIGPSLRLVLHGFERVSPIVAEMVQGFGQMLGAVHTHMNALAGENGLGGTIEDVEAVIDLIRDIDLTPVTDPLDDLFARIEAALASISPDALRAPLEAARDAIAGLIDLSILIDPADEAALDAAYQSVVAKLRTLSPSAAIGEPLDAEYETLLATILPVMEMPARLRAALLEAGLGLSAEVTLELARVEAAFDEMLRQIPIRTGVSVDASASLSVSVSV